MSADGQDAEIASDDSGVLSKAESSSGDDTYHEEPMMSQGEEGSWMDQMDGSSENSIYDSHASWMDETDLRKTQPQDDDKGIDEGIVDESGSNMDMGGSEETEQNLFV